VLSASVTVDKQLISSVGKGILVFAAVANGDTEKDVDALAAKVLKMKLWDDEAGGRVRQTLLPILYRPLIAQKWKKSVQDIQGEILCGR
jgi:D-tyrosyl-tRNA(Tyr) deacylase